jgi:hypothetical protein
MMVHAPKRVEYRPNEGARTVAEGTSVGPRASLDGDLEQVLAAHSESERAAMRAFLGLHCQSHALALGPPT